MNLHRMSRYKLHFDFNPKNHNKAQRIKRHLYKGFLGGFFMKKSFHRLTEIDKYISFIFSE